MDAILKAKWIEALRSGKYRQGMGELRDVYNNMCCLGVLRDVMDQSDRRGGVSLVAAQLGQCGLSDEQQNNCIKLNDGLMGKRVHTFPEIADYIEREL